MSIRTPTRADLPGTDSPGTDNPGTDNPGTDSMAEANTADAKAGARAVQREAVDAAPAPIRSISAVAAGRKAVRWTIYSRPECSLCDVLLADLLALLPSQDASGIEVVDISQDAALERKYGLRIPVLMADGDFVCAHRLDARRVQAYLD